MHVKSAIVLLLVLTGVTACDDASKQTTSPNQTSAAPVAPAPPDAAAIANAQAIQLAKDAHTLTGGRLPSKLFPAEVLTNEYQIKAQLSQIKGDITVTGWRAQKWNDDTYLVTYTYEHLGQSVGWPFEVKLSQGVVRSVIGDPELETKYGWGK